MKKSNLRVDKPSVRIKYEFTKREPLNKLIVDALQADYGNIDNLEIMVKMKSITFRSSGIVLGESKEILVEGRPHFATFTSNSYVASANFENTSLETWRHGFIRDPLLSGPKFYNVRITGDTIDTSYGVTEEFQMTYGSNQEGVTSVLTFDLIVTNKTL